MKFALLGRTHWLLNSLIKAEAAGHELALVGTCRASPEYSVSEHDFKLAAQERDVPFFCDADADAHIATLKACHAEVALSMNWLRLLSGNVLAAFPLGVVNAHPSDLPSYRGNAAPNWAILNGETRVGVSLHRMVSELDAGPVYLKRFMALNDDIQIGDVYTFLNEVIPEMFVELLDGLESGTLRATDQRVEDASRGLPRRPEDSELDWGCEAEFLARVVRASSEPFQGAFSRLDGVLLRVWRARAEPASTRLIGVPGQVVERRANGDVAVLTANGLLILELVSLENSERTSPSNVIRSLRSRFGRGNA